MQISVPSRHFKLVKHVFDVGAGVALDDMTPVVTAVKAAMDCEDRVILDFPNTKQHNMFLECLTVGTDGHPEVNDDVWRDVILPLIRLA